MPNYAEPFFGAGAVLLARPHPPHIETANDKDGYVANFWRAVQHDPEQVAHWADWPVSELDLHARHRWLVTTAAERVERVRADPDFYDPQIAGWWVWGLCQWIGGGWCSGRPRRLTAQRPDLHGPGTGLLAGLTANGRRRPHLNYDQGLLAGTAKTCAEQRAHLIDVLSALRDRLRQVRVCCGDWTRILGPTPTYLVGVTGVFLDPPYGHAERDANLYGVDEDIAPAVRDWAIANGENPRLRIALCGYESEHAMPASWAVVRWKGHGGYAHLGTNRGQANRHRETIWFSPHCLTPGIRQLELDGGGR